MALLVMLVVWLSHTRGMFHCADDFVADLLHARQTTTQLPNSVLLVYADREIFQFKDGRLIDLIKLIERYQPSQIGIAHPLPPEQETELVNAGLAGNVIVGDTLANLCMQPADSKQVSLQRGFLDLQLGNQATYRWHRARVIGSQQNVDSLEACLARAQPGTGARIPAGEFGIRFQGGAAGLPHVDEVAFLEGTVISELVQDRIVLIGSREEDGLGFVTPTTRGGQRMSRLELHGNILETILQRSAIQRADRLQTLLILLVVTITSALVFRRIATRWILRAGLGWFAILLACCWLTITYWSIQISPVSMLLICLLNFVTALKDRFQILSKFFDQWKLLRRTNIKTTWNASYDEIWSSVATSVLQMFSPRRLVLLELETGSVHLRVREILGCEESEIKEKRRDVSRVPYRPAIELRHPVAIDDRPFLCQDEEGSQFMVPLIDGADVQGMLVLEMARTALTELDFEDRLADFADKMAAFLKDTRERELEQIVSQMPLRRLRYVPERIAARALFQDEVDHRRYEDMLDRALDCSEVAVAIYDVFGNLLKANKRMIDQLQERDISVPDTNCADIVAALTGRSVPSCRELVRRCLIGNHAEEILLAAEKSGEAASVLYVKPLGSADDFVDEGFENRCISIQYVDGGVFDDLHRWQTRFAESQSEVLRDQIWRLQKCLVQIESDEDDPGLQDYKTLAAEMLDAVDQCQSAINFGLSEHAEDFLLVDSSPILQAALDACKEECESRGVSIKRASHVDDAFAISNPILLRRVFAFAIDCLLDGASRQTEIVIDAKSIDDRLCYRFHVVARSSSIRGDESKEHKAWKVTASARPGKAASVLIQKHSERLIEVSRWLRQWGATLSIQCAHNYQPSIEIDLAGNEPDRHSGDDVDESVKSESTSPATEDDHG